MNILFLTPYFPPEVGAPQTRIYEMALRLKRLGNDISVLTTFPNYPTGVVPPQWRGKLFWKGEEAGIRVFRVWSYATRNAGFYKRILSQLSFPGFAVLAAGLLPRADAIIVESPPLFDGFAGLLLGWLKRAPYIFNVADLWPEAAVQLGVLRNPALIWLSKRSELLFYRRAALVLAVTAGIRDAIVAGGIDPAKVILFRNAVDTEFFAPRADAAELRRELGVAPDEFMVLYAGTLGLAQQLDAVIEAAAIFQSEASPKVRFVLAGAGAEAEALRQKVDILQLRNTSFAGVYPKARMPQLLNAADCLLVSLRNLDIFRWALPTKMFEAMACARPLVLVAQGEAEELVREAGAGRCACPGDPQSIHDAIANMMADPATAQQMGKRGRDYMQAHFSRDQRAQQLAALLRKARYPGEQTAEGTAVVERRSA